MTAFYRFFYDTYIEMSLAVACLLYILWNWQGDLGHLVGFGLAIIAMPFWIKARLDLGLSYSVLPQAARLVTTGIYGKIRHPMYLFSTLVLLGIVIALGYKILYALVAIVTIMQFIRAREEDLVLLAHYGSIFTEYRKLTWF